ncbi:MAG: cobalamin B12-binding domain-containing protein [Boseongicola sp.]|nr:cobalamin B12-binding domain-containing protein [Boseongicola sp.]
MRTLKSQLPEDSVESLAREVIRRLAKRDGTLTVNSPSDEVIERLCDVLLSDDDHAGADFIQKIEADGATIEVVYLEYLARAARMLGLWWEEDKISFMSVTLGTSRMFAIMRGLNGRFSASQSTQKRKALFASVPGETHTLGVRLAADLFRRDGWEIGLKLGASHDELVESVEASDAVLIGLSAAGQHSIAALSQLVVALRISKPSAKIIVSGNSAVVAAETVLLLGVDGIAQDVQAARFLMNNLWNETSGAASQS